MARPCLQDHPKFQRLVYLLQIPEPYVLGLLEYVWRVGYACGESRIGDVTDVELAAKWPGEKGKLVQALMECGGQGRAGFIELAPGTNDVYQIHDLLENAPGFVSSRRMMEGERKKLKRCARCGIEYHSSKKHSKFCSDYCRVAHHRNATDTQCNERVTLRNASVTPCYASPAPAPAPARAPALAHTHTNGDTERNGHLRNGALHGVQQDPTLLGFKEFIEAYPKKMDNLTAQYEWQALRVTQELVNTIMASLERQKKSEQWKQLKHIPSPMRWLREHKWADELPMAETQAERISRYIKD